MKTMLPHAPLWQVPLTQSELTMQDALHDVPFAQMRPPGQDAGVPGAQVPPPLHVGADVRIDPEQDGLPQVLPFGNRHVPAALQSVAPHAPPIGLQAAVQQWVPVPTVPQTSLEHSSFAVQVEPLPS